MLRGSLGESAVSLVFEKRVYVLKGTNKYLFSWIFSLFTSFPLFPLVRRIFCYPLTFLSATTTVPCMCCRLFESHTKCALELINLHGEWR